MILKTLLFAITFLYEPELLKHNVIKIKYRNKVDIEADIKKQLLGITPNLIPQHSCLTLSEECYKFEIAGSVYINKMVFSLVRVLQNVFFKRFSTN